MMTCTTLEISPSANVLSVETYNGNPKLNANKEKKSEVVGHGQR